MSGGGLAESLGSLLFSTLACRMGGRMHLGEALM